MHVQWLRERQQPATQEQSQRPARRRSVDVQYDMLARRPSKEKHNFKSPRSKSQRNSRDGDDIVLAGAHKHSLLRLAQLSKGVTSPHEACEPTTDQSKKGRPGSLKSHVPSAFSFQSPDLAFAEKLSPPPLQAMAVSEASDKENDSAKRKTAAAVCSESQQQLVAQLRSLYPLVQIPDVTPAPLQIEDSLVQIPVVTPAPLQVEVASDNIKKEIEENARRQGSKSSVVSITSDDNSKPRRRGSKSSVVSITSIDSSNSVDIDAESQDYAARLQRVSSPAGTPGALQLEALSEGPGRRLSNVSTISFVSKSSADMDAEFQDYIGRLPLVQSRSGTPAPVQVEAASEIPVKEGEQKPKRVYRRPTLGRIKSTESKSSADIDAEFEDLFSSYHKPRPPSCGPPSRKQSFRDSLDFDDSVNRGLRQDKESYSSIVSQQKEKAEAGCESFGDKGDESKACFSNRMREGFSKAWKLKLDAVKRKSLTLQMPRRASGVIGVDNDQLGLDDGGA